MKINESIYTLGKSLMRVRIPESKQGSSFAIGAFINGAVRQLCRNSEIDKIHDQYKNNKGARFPSLSAVGDYYRYLRELGHTPTVKQYELLGKYGISLVIAEIMAGDQQES